MVEEKGQLYIVSTDDSDAVLVGTSTHTLLTTANEIVEEGEEEASLFALAIAHLSAALESLTGGCVFGDGVPAGLWLRNSAFHGVGAGAGTRARVPILLAHADAPSTPAILAALMGGGSGGGEAEALLASIPAGGAVVRVLSYTSEVAVAWGSSDEEDNNNAVTLRDTALVVIGRTVAALLAATKALCRRLLDHDSSSASVTVNEDMIAPVLTTVVGVGGDAAVNKAVPGEDLAEEEEEAAGESASCTLCGNAFSYVSKYKAFPMCDGCYQAAFQADMQTVRVLRFEEPDHICDNVFLGPEGATIDEDFLRRGNFDRILTVAAHSAEHLPSFDFIEYLRLDVDDDPVHGNLLPHFDPAIDFIQKSPSTNILVHCVSGISRSAATVCAYIMKTRVFGFDDALAFVRERRSCVHPNSGFKAQLRQYEAELRSRRGEEEGGVA